MFTLLKGLNDFYIIVKYYSQIKKKINIQLYWKYHELPTLN
jgi:hypothetical protein